MMRIGPLSYITVFSYHDFLHRWQG